jgi:type 1 glutamine amidotransferase
MSDKPFRAHVITGGYAPGAAAGHDHDYARLRLLQLLADAGVRSSAGNDFADVGKWLDVSRLMITYVAGPYPDDEQNRVIRDWLAQGGKWLGLHGTSGGKASRIAEGQRRRRMVKTSHHDTLGGFFINHPPVRRFQVDVEDSRSPLLKDLPRNFEVVDELYMIEVQHPEDTKVLLTTELERDPSPEGFGFYYDEDTSLQPDGKTRVLGLARDIGKGSVAYIALGHCHTPETSTQPFVDVSVDPEGKTPPLLRGPWEEPAFEQLLRNAVEWGMG